MVMKATKLNLGIIAAVAAVAITGGVFALGNKTSHASTIGAVQPVQTGLEATPAVDKTQTPEPTPATPTPTTTKAPVPVQKTAETAPAAQQSEVVTPASPKTVVSTAVVTTAATTVVRVGGGPQYVTPWCQITFSDGTTSRYLLGDQIPENQLPVTCAAK